MPTEAVITNFRYQMEVARFLGANYADGFKFAAFPVNEPLIGNRYSGYFLARARNLIFACETNTGKTHLAVAVASPCIKTGLLAIFFSAIDLVNLYEP